uniref:NADH dehydrogenase subunit 5 n=1 Tax=Eomenopon denticulatum TaxID=2965267 RepID=UPI0026E2584F|nr:NADH dehydrogenase subunit 5 [Eomenopon denticulatum]WIM51545.1 NADH dehydrogenase subunit 5 [Eomenopon denticulatum]
MCSRYYLNYYKKYVMMFMFLFLCLMILVEYLLSEVYVFEWVLFFFYDFHISLGLIFDQNSWVFTFTVVMVYLSVWFYSSVYMESETYLDRFTKIMTVFMGSMLILIHSNGLMTSMVGWDGLGITSMILIMYYSSNSALKSSIFTFMINRLGDSFFMILVILSYCVHSSSVLYNGTASWIISLFLILTSMTKSSQFPFSSWLVKAMEAPTPVSSLVHSSTLVTAGAYLIIIHKEVWCGGFGLLMFLSMSAFITMMVANLSSLMEMDLKKIIAYSTLSQLSFIYVCISLHMADQAFFYMIMHAFFKAMMFMVVGFVIHYSSGWQDIRILGLNQMSTPCMMNIFVASSLSLCGMPYLSGFFSKDLVVDLFTSLNFSLFFFSFLGLSFGFSCVYCIRMGWYLGVMTKKVICYKLDDEVMISSMLVLYILSCLMGGASYWIMGPMGVGIDSPKILLIFLLMVISWKFWNFFNIKWMNVYMKTGFYLNLAINYVHSFLFFFSFEFICSSDMGLASKLCYTRKYSVNKLIDSNYFKIISMFVDFKEILVLGVFLVMI